MNFFKTFLPYIIENYSKEYIIANFIGESLSSLVPGLLSIAQGYPKEENCFNSSDTINSSIITANQTIYNDDLQLNFSISVYFLLMFTLLSLSGVSFGFVHFLKFSKNNRRIKPTTSESYESDTKSQSYEIKNSTSSLNLYAKDEKGQMQDDATKIGNKKIQILCYFLSFLVSFAYYGIMPGIQVTLIFL